MRDREIEDRGEIRDGAWPKMLEMDHSDPIRPSGRRGFGPTDGSFDVSVNEGRKVRHQLLLLDLSKNLPRYWELFVRADGGELLVEFLRDSSSFSVDFAFE